tara:strand:- start:501 stop:1958 length:1458 start_codon:yes stop_codon:yes gene_type:complete
MDENNLTNEDETKLTEINDTLGRNERYRLQGWPRMVHFYKQQLDTLQIKREVQVLEEEIRNLEITEKKLEDTIKGFYLYNLLQYLKNYPLEYFIGLTATFGTYDIFKEMMLLFRSKHGEEQIIKENCEFMKVGDNTSNTILSSLLQQCNISEYLMANNDATQVELQASQLVKNVCLVGFSKTMQKDTSGSLFPIVERPPEKDGYLANMESSIQFVDMADKVIQSAEANDWAKWLELTTKDHNLSNKYWNASRRPLIMKCLDIFVENNNINKYCQKALLILKKDGMPRHIFEALHEDSKPEWNEALDIGTKRLTHNDKKITVIFNDHQTFLDIVPVPEDDNLTILVVSHNTGGVGVDYKNVHLLFKFGFFNYSDNIQIDGRVNRLKFFSENIPTQYRQIKKIFMLPFIYIDTLKGGDSIPGFSKKRITNYNHLTQLAMRKNYTSDKKQLIHCLSLAYYMLLEFEKSYEIILYTIMTHCIGQDLILY